MRIIPRPGYIVCEVLREKPEQELPQRYRVAQVPKGERSESLLGVEVVLASGVPCTKYTEGGKVYLVLSVEAIVAHVCREENADA